MMTGGDLSSENIRKSNEMWRADSLEKTLNAGKDWRQKEKGVADG